MGFDGVQYIIRDFLPLYCLCTDVFWTWISEFSYFSLNVALLLVTIIAYENLSRFS